MTPEQFQNVHWVALAAIIGFVLLAFLLLYPVYRFIRREETASRKWTHDEIARATRRQRHGGDGKAPDDDGETEGRG